jgi:hypothetical protein
LWEVRMSHLSHSVLRRVVTNQELINIVYLEQMTRRWTMSCKYHPHLYTE